MKICVVGTGYVGLSISALLCQNHELICLDIDSKRVDLINKKICPIQDEELEKFFSNKEIKLNATLDKELAYLDADYVVIATPTDYDPETDYFNTSSVESVIKDATKINPKATIVIKSTIPVGFTEKIKRLFNINQIFFSPEFLREGRALHDNFYPSRIIVGDRSDKGKEFANILATNSKKEGVDILFTGNTEAEAIKLFSNTYLAMRVSFFNELDSFAFLMNLNSREIIRGVSLDPRIGDFYNNPSFGYGGYCLPKDTKQLLSNYENVPQNLISAIVSSNETRIDVITNAIINVAQGKIGIYRLVMKKDSDNFRSSAISQIIEKLLEKNQELIIYEPGIESERFSGLKVEHNLKKFLEDCSLIVANRIHAEIEAVQDKVFTRDIFNSD